MPAGGTHLDSELLSRAQSGDRAAYGMLVSRYQDRLYNAMLRMVGNSDEARELTQEAFLRGLEKIGAFRGEAQPYTWLCRIAMNLAISQLRKVRRTRVFSLDAPNGRADRRGDQAATLASRVREPAAGPEAGLERRELQQQVLSALGRLDAEYRAILVMRDVDDMDYQQIADVLEVPLGTLKSRLFRARLALRDALRGYMA